MAVLNVDQGPLPPIKAVPASTPPIKDPPRHQSADQGSSGVVGSLARSD
jgi:hypothetical protein